MKSLNKVQLRSFISSQFNCKWWNRKKKIPIQKNCQRKKDNNKNNGDQIWKKKKLIEDEIVKQKI
jgi:hypothetical protein